MNKKQNGTILSSIIVSALLLGCGTSLSSPTVSTAGKVVDDYIKGAKVCADVNENGKADDGDANCVITDSNGAFNFGRRVTASLVMSGGVDIGTNKPFTGTFLAPAESKVINPLTTIVSSIQKTGKSVEEAQDIVKDKLGLPDVDLTTFDPLSEVVYGADNAAKEDAKKVLAQQSNIQVVLTVVATTIASASTNVHERDVTEQASNQIAALMLAANTNSSAVNVASQASVGTILSGTATTVLASEPTAIAQVQAVTTVVSQQTEAVSSAVVSNVEAISVNSAETGADAIAEANAALLLVTDQDNANSVSNLIEEAVTTGSTTDLGNVNVNAEIQNSQSALPERPKTPETTESSNSAVTPTTGGSGGN